MQSSNSKKQDLNVLKHTLSPQEYTWSNALLWGNFLGHCRKAQKSWGCNRVIHILVAVIQAIPIIGQIASIFEKLIVNCLQVPQKILNPKSFSIKKEKTVTVTKIQNITQNIEEKPSKPSGIKWKREYANGVVEIFEKDNDGNYKGVKHYPNKTQVRGTFDENGALTSGYSMNENGDILFTAYPSLLSFEDPTSKKTIDIIDLEGELIVLEKDDEGTYKLVTVQLDDVSPITAAPPNHPLLKACRLQGTPKSIKKVLTHPKFNLELFVKEALELDGDKPRLFGFSNIAMDELLEIAFEKGIDVETILGPKAKNWQNGTRKLFKKQA
jgi:hypothetical protein